MLNFTIKPGEYFMVGKDIRIVFLGGTAHNYRVMIEANTILKYLMAHRNMKFLIS